MNQEPLIIKASHGWRGIDFRELREYQDLFYFLVWRDIKVRYAQSVLGIGWAIIQPIVYMLAFSLVFGKFVGVQSDGIPYPIFSLAGLIPWTYFSGSLSGATGSVPSAQNLISKIYFPRIILPLASVFGKVIDFGISLLILGLLMAYYGIVPGWGILLLPMLLIVLMMTAAGLGMWLTSLSVQYRDVAYAQGFLIQILLYATPVVYPASLIPESNRLIYGLNPLVGIIESFRAAVLGHKPIPWDLLGVGTAMALVIFVTGVLYFKRMERNFADIV